MSNIIQISLKKALKLTNVLITEIDLTKQEELPIIVTQIHNYIKTKGAIPVGPLIRKTVFNVNEDGNIHIHVYLLAQINNYIHSVDEPYKMESIIRVRNCMYAHYVGPEEKLKLAYDKINITAFEEDIELSNENYTIFVDQQDDNIVADIFVEKKSDD